MDPKSLEADCWQNIAQKIEKLAKSRNQLTKKLP
jgi:hypothetical protein